MLNQFSWTQFLVTSAILTTCWYIGLFLTVYRKETLSFFSGSPSSSDPDPSQVISETNTSDIEQELMGKSVSPEGLERVSMSELSFSHTESSAIYNEDSRADQIGLVPDVIQELKEIFKVLAREDGTKKDFLSLAVLIGEKYGRIGSNPNISKINAFIREQAPFAISNDELENLWG